MTPLQHHQKRIKANISIQAELLLDLVKTMMADGQPRTLMACNDLAVYHKIGSSSTMHKAMDSLVKNKLVVFINHDKDGRSKHCSITQRGFYYLADDQEWA